MKKVLAWVLCLMLTLGMVGAASAEFAPVAKEDVKVGFIFIGDVSDKGYTYAHYQGLLAMQEALGLTDDQIIIKTNVPEDSACDAAMLELIEAGCQIIFGNSYGYMNYMAEMAEEYPEVIFSHCSGYMSNDVNFNNYFGAIYQARYLSGIAAGMKTQTNKIGYVAAMQTPEVIGGFDAFALGVQSVNPDAVVYVKYTNSWYDATLERQTADARNAPFQHEQTGNLRRHRADGDREVDAHARDNRDDEREHDEHIARQAAEQLVEHIVGRVAGESHAHRAEHDEHDGHDVVARSVAQSILIHGSHLPTW